MNKTTFTADEAFGILNGVALEKTNWQSLLGGNQKFWTVPESFKLDDYAFPSDSFHRFDVWGTDDNGNTVIRCWSKW